MTGIYRGVGTSGTGISVEDLVASKVNISGDTMTGYLTVPAGATGAQAPQKQEIDTLLALKASTSALALKANIASPTFTGIVGGIDGTMIVNIPAGGISAITAQSAINELDTLKEPTANKSTSVITDQASNVKFPSVKAVYDWVVGLFVAKTSTTGSAILPASTTANRDGSPVVGYLRYNTSLSQFEGYGSAGWGKVGGGAVGGGTDAVFYQNDSVVTQPWLIGQDAQISGAVFTLTNPTIAFVAHGKVAGSQVCFTTTGALPTGFAIGTKYYVIATGLTADALQVSATYGGTAITPTVSQSGTHSMGNIKNAQVAGPLFGLAAIGSTGGRLTVV